MQPIFLKTNSIPDAWFQSIYNLVDYGRKYIVEQGSFVGETRLEFDSATIFIENTYTEPWKLMLPEIPSHFNIPNPVADDYIEQYMPYLMTDVVEPGEEYSYGKRISWQIPVVEKLLKETPNTNQAILQVAQPNDILLDDPPCLREIGCKIKDDKLIFFPVFRSWDLWGGFPANLAGISVLQKFMADNIGVGVGSMVVYSWGLHIYGYVEELVKIRTMKE